MNLPSGAEGHGFNRAVTGASYDPLHFAPRADCSNNPPAAQNSWEKRPGLGGVETPPFLKSQTFHE
jgi:hypothetical protein